MIKMSEISVEDLKDWLNTNLARVMYASMSKDNETRKLWANLDGTFTVEYAIKGNCGSENFDSPEKAVTYFNSCYDQ